MDSKRLQYLFRQYLNRSAKRKEEKELIHFLADPENEAVIKDILSEYWDQSLSEEYPEKVPPNSGTLYQNILQKLPGIPFHPRRKLKILKWQKWAAAVLILLLGTGSYLLLHKEFKNPDRELSKNIKPPLQNIAAPSTANAVLTLANGKQINLDSLQNGSLGTQGSAQIRKLANGEIAYQNSGKKNGKVLYNTLSVPKGSRIMRLTLADGSKVWLNAASTLKYPTVFSEKERKVKISGEAYFEIANQPDKPFIVSTGQIRVQVLGTHFNIKAYPEEENSSATLLQGSVRVISKKGDRILSPGEETQVNKNGRIKLVKNADVQKAVAWKNGFFSFQDATIKEVMRQLARWYDLEVQYTGAAPSETFSGEIGKDLSLQEVFNILKETRVHYKIEANKKVIIMP